VYPWQVNLLFPLVYKGTEYKGKHYGVPMFLYVHTLFYRSDLIKELGLEVPKTWQELLNVGKKVTNSPQTYGFGLVGGGGRAKHVIYYFSDLLWSWGAEYFDEKGNAAFNSGNRKPSLTKTTSSSSLP